MKLRIKYVIPGYLIFISLLAVFCLGASHSVNALTQKNESAGVQGKVNSPPPTIPATITTPSAGQVFTTTPITVSGLCKGDVLVSIYKNGVFGGSTQCTNGSYSLQVDLFSGTNELVAKISDALGQEGPDSITTVVTFNDAKYGTVGKRVTLTSNFAKRGANPGSVLTWPLILSGGVGPYAISADWGDVKSVTLVSKEFAGNIDLTHIYDSAGQYNIIIKATDKNGDSAFLQVVGIANGAVTKTADTNQQDGTANQTGKQIIPIWAISVLVLLIAGISFWLGNRYALQNLRRRLDREQ